MSINSLCFKEALDAREKGEIELEEFLRHIVDHCRGVKHAADAEGQRPWLYAGFTDEVRTCVLSENYQPLDDDNTAVLYSIFLSAFEGDVAAVRKLLDTSTIGPEYYLRPLVYICIPEGNPQLLRVCLEKGFLPTGYNDANRLLDHRLHSNPSTEWLDVLFEFDFRQWRTDLQQLNTQRTWRHVIHMGVDCVRWLIEHGGCTPGARGLFDQSFHQGWPGAPTLRILLDQFGIDWFKDSGALQLAVEYHDLDTVRMLVEAGADVNEDVTDWQMDIREPRAAPLPALQVAVYAQSETMIRYLVEHGAKVPLKFVTDPYNMTPKKYKPFRALVAELGAVEEETSL